MSETRVQAAMLVCKIFLHYLVLLSEWDGMLDLWLKILDILDRMMNSGQGDSLEEAIPESLKNILLVMADGGYLSPPSEDSSNETLWIETQKRLDRFLPNLFTDIFPRQQQQQHLTQKPSSVTPPVSDPQCQHRQIEVVEGGDSLVIVDKNVGRASLENNDGDDEAD